MRIACRQTARNIGDQISRQIHLVVEGAAENAARNRTIGWIVFMTISAIRATSIGVRRIVAIEFGHKLVAVVHTQSAEVFVQATYAKVVAAVVATYRVHVTHV